MSAELLAPRLNVEQRGRGVNWRGPIWMPINFLLVEALFQANPHWRDHVPFHEYFHGDSGRGVGASHQTGWTGVVAKLLEQTATQMTAPRRGCAPALPRHFGRTRR